MATRLTKWTHSCVTLEKDAGKLVLDPGAFSETGPALAGATAVLITHEHPDHIDVEAVRAALTADEALTLHAPASVAALFEPFGDRVTAVAGGASFDAGGFAVRTFGDQHALLHSRVPVIANVGYLVDGDVFHPGDAFTVPEVAVGTLLIPATAPWAKLSETVDYAVAVRPPRVIPIHEAVYSEIGRSTVNGQVSTVLAGFGSGYEVVDPGSSVDL